MLAALCPCVASAGPRGNPSCWTHGFTFEQCCGIIYGRRGNPHCWDAGQHNFDFCCRGEQFTPQGCLDFATNFDFAMLLNNIPAWERCVAAMEDDAVNCNSAEATEARCPACADLSSMAVEHIRCVRQEQSRTGKSDGSSGDDHNEPRALVGGWHYPTLFVPRKSGREFSVAAPAFDAYVGNRLVTDGHWMAHEIALVKGLMKPGEVFIDAGANIGAFTLPLAKHLGPEGTVHAFEPFRLLFQCLNANIMLNGLSNVFTYQVGLGNVTGRVERRQPNLNAFSNPSKMHVAEFVASELMVRTDPRPDAEEWVQVQRLDDIDFGRRGPDFMKVDVESMELALVQGGEQMLQRYRPSLYIEDSEVPEGSDGRHRPTRLTTFLFVRGYLMVDLIRSGFADATSTLFVPQEKESEVIHRLNTLQFDIPR